jgi:hypothetical protein
MASDPLVKEAKQRLMENFTTIHNKLEGIADYIDGEHFASAQWKETLGMTPDELLLECLEGKVQGGIVTQGLITYHTDVEITAVHEESINAKASDEQVKVGIHPAMLATLPPGPVKKTRRVFVILKRNHFHFAFTKQGDKKKAIFDIGAEADEAQALIVAFLKSQNKGPLGKLSESERKEEIAKALDKAKAVSWSDVASQNTGPVAGQNKPTPTNTPAGAHVVDPAEPKELCRNYERDQQCRYGSYCKFFHDDSRKARSRRKRQWKRAEVASILSESRSRTRTRNRDKSRSPSRSRSRSRGRSRSRSSSGSRSPQPREPQWKTVARRTVQLRLRCRKSVHPAAWRTSLRSINKPAYQLVTWVDRDSADEDWLQVQCGAEDVGKLEKLLQQDFTVERQRRRPNKESKRRTHHCADFLKGDRCKHSKPYCS